MSHLWILLRNHPNHSSVVVLERILYIPQHVINDLERVNELACPHEVIPVLVTDNVLTSLGLLAHACQLRQAVL